MKTSTLLMALLLSASILLGQYNKIDTSFFSETLQETKMVDVYFPPGYDENPELYYPVIYYLHAWLADQNLMGSEMLAITQSMINNGSISPVIMVCADNSPDPFDGSMYANSILWGNYDDYMITDLIHWIENSFRAMPSKNYRALLGHSMGGYGAFRYGTLHKDKFRVLAATASAIINLTDDYLEYSRQKIMQQNQPGPPFYYNYYSTGGSTMGLFLFCGAFSPNLNTPQTYINPQIVEFSMDSNGYWIDTIVDKMKNNSIDHLIHQLSTEDSIGILFGCGSADVSIYPCHIAFKDTLDLLGLPYEFYDHSGGHIMPSGFKQRALIFIDSLLMPPGPYTNIAPITKRDDLFILENYPNPFRNITTIQFILSENSYVELNILNHLGQQIGILFKGKKIAGRHQVVFDDKELPEGFYICRIKVGNEMISKKIIKVN
jgi:S-formylglutathione hydrolase FrmB